MYVITNRRIHPRRRGLARLGATPNEEGGNNLRIARIERDGEDWEVELLPDRPLRKREVKALIREFDLDIDPREDWYPSLRVACDIARRAREHRRHVLFFVHGYNNDVASVLQSAQLLRDRYDVEVVPFSWPANGGGIHGTLSYKSDKRDARASAGALERTLKRMHCYFHCIARAQRAETLARAEGRHRDNPEARDMLYTQLLREACPFTVNAMYHSMGNYLLKQMLKSSVSEGNGLLFDNIVLCQADTNHFEHPLWVDRIRFRKRLFITINENDYALAASRAKLGSEQLARLGHYARDLTSRNAHYVNLTRAQAVETSHSPFGEPAQRNEDLATFFGDAFAGEPAESRLRYRPEGNWYALP